MPALDWRIIPARSINRCETICASLGLSRSTGRKYSERRIKPNPGDRAAHSKERSDTCPSTHPPIAGAPGGQKFLKIRVTAPRPHEYDHFSCRQACRPEFREEPTTERGRRHACLFGFGDTPR